MKLKDKILLVTFVSFVTVLAVISTFRRTAANPASTAASTISTNGFNFTIAKEMIPTISGNYVHSVTVDLK